MHFFKALLFLSAGSVIHAVNNEQDIRKMGGLCSHIPFTYVAMLIGSLALSGIVPFAGFYSKDVIISGLYLFGDSYGILFSISAFTAFLTAVYSFRVFFIVFHGEYRGDVKPHESGSQMLFPLFILAIGAIFSGIIGDRVGIVSDISGLWQNSLHIRFSDDIFHALNSHFPLKGTCIIIFCWFFRNNCFLSNLFG